MPYRFAVSNKGNVALTGITVTDPKALTKPWEIVRTSRKASASNDELREFACAEGLTREFKPR